MGPIASNKISDGLRDSKFDSIDIRLCDAGIVLQCVSPQSHNYGDRIIVC